MKVPSEQVAFKKKVGKTNDADVYHIKTTGGLHLMAKAKPSGSMEILGTGPHRAVARHIANQYDDGIVWTELSKSDHYDIASFEHLLAKYEEITREFRKLQGR